MTKIPTGAETGVFLAVDLGGTNCRICSINLHGDSTYTLHQSKHAVSRDLRVNVSYRPLFAFIADRIRCFLEEHPELGSGDLKETSKIRGEPGQSTKENHLRLGFTFSFACDQWSLAAGKLLHWDKGWDIPDALGRNPCAMLQEAIDEMGLPVLVTVLANDSVGTLMARAYTAPSSTPTLIGAIFGTGTNAAYAEWLPNITRLHGRDEYKHYSPDDMMIINTEWGCFDEDLQVLPSTAYDEMLDVASQQPKEQMLEKQVSGMYLGELLRLVVLQLVKAEAFDMTIDGESPVNHQGRIDSAILSNLATDESQSLETARQHVAASFGARNVTVEDARAIRLIAMAIARRAARLAAASLAAIILHSGRLQQSSLPSKSAETSMPELQQPRAPITTRDRHSKFYLGFTQLVGRLLRSVGLSWVKMDPFALAEPLSSGPHRGICTILEEDVIDIGVEGSLIEFYPKFEGEIREALREMPEIGPEGEKRIRIGLAKNGAALGAALMAQAAMLQNDDCT